MARQKKVKGRGAGIRTVSLPPDLNARMAKCDGVNWSAVAVRAFEQELGRLAAEKEVKNMDDVIARLRASKNDRSDEAYQAGHSLGESWAKQDADVLELRRLEKLWRDTEDWPGFFEVDSGSAYGADEFLAFQITGADRDRDAASGFWEVAFGDGERHEDELSEPTWLRGFADGALSVWNTVKDHI